MNILQWQNFSDVTRTKENHKEMGEGSGVADILGSPQQLGDAGVEGGAQIDPMISLHCGGRRSCQSHGGAVFSDSSPPIFLEMLLSSHPASAFYFHYSLFSIWWHNNMLNWYLTVCLSLIHFYGSITIPSEWPSCLSADVTYMKKIKMKQKYWNSQQLSMQGISLKNFDDYKL